MRLFESIKLLGSRFETQSGYLGDIPENAMARDFTKDNNVARMAVLFLGSISVQEGAGGTEGLVSWQHRTEADWPLDLPIADLAAATGMLIGLDKPFLFTRHALRSAAEWRLVRNLAANLCCTLSVPRDLRYPDFETLWAELGNDMIDVSDYLSP